MTTSNYDTKKAVAVMMLAGKSDASIARAVKVDRATIGRWRKDDKDLKQALLDVNDQWITQQVAEAKALMPDAWKAIKSALQGSDAKLRLEAAKLLLSGVNVQQAVQGKLGTTKEDVERGAGRIVVNVIMDQAQGVVATDTRTAIDVQSVSVDT